MIKGAKELRIALKGRVIWECGIGVNKIREIYFKIDEEKVGKVRIVESEGISLDKLRKIKEGLMMNDLSDEGDWLKVYDKRKDLLIPSWIIEMLARGYELKDFRRLCCYGKEREKFASYLIESKDYEFFGKAMLGKEVEVGYEGNGEISLWNFYYDESLDLEREEVVLIKRNSESDKSMIWSYDLLEIKKHVERWKGRKSLTLTIRKGIEIFQDWFMRERERMIMNRGAIIDIKFMGLMNLGSGNEIRKNSDAAYFFSIKRIKYEEFRNFREWFNQERGE